MEIGKLPPEILEQLILKPITQSETKRSEVKVRPKTGEDCTAVDFGDELCVMSTDPITGAEKDAGYLAVHINCNDIASSGAVPIGILVTLLLPLSSSEETIKEIMSGVQKATKELGIEILGGHTEVTDAVTKPVLSATAVGKTSNQNFVSTGGAKEGQDIVMTKWAGLEGTLIIAKDYEEQLKNILPEQVILDAQKMDGFLSVVPEARIAVKYGATAMHDATEGGVLGAVWEMADCSNVGVTVDLEKIPVKNETNLVCKASGIDPFGLISSGTLIISTFQGKKLVEQLKKEDIEAEIIGKVTKKQRIVYEKGQEKPLNQPVSDALYRVKINKLNQ